MPRASTTLKHWCFNIENNPGQGTRIVSSIELPAFQVQFNKTRVQRKSNQGHCTVHISCKTTSIRFFLCCTPEEQKRLFSFCARKDEQRAGRQGERRYMIPHQQDFVTKGGVGVCEQARWPQAGPSPVMQCKNIFCGEQRTMYLYLALGKYGSYHRHTSSHVENSFLYKVLTNLMFWASKFGQKLGQVSTLQICKN